MPKYFVISLLASLLLLLTQSGCDSVDYEARYRKLWTKHDSLAQTVQTLRQENARFREATGEPLDVGFEVQIGAFAHFDVAAYNEELVRFSKVKSEELNKYVLGRFSTFEDAESFLEDVQNMGLTDAFIAGVVDGKRSTVEEAKKLLKPFFSESSGFKPRAAHFPGFARTIR